MTDKTEEPEIIRAAQVTIRRGGPMGESILYALIVFLFFWYVLPRLIP